MSKLVDAHVLDFAVGGRVCPKGTYSSILVFSFLKYSTGVRLETEQ